MKTVHVVLVDHKGQQGARVAGVYDDAETAYKVAIDLSASYQNEKFPPCVRFSTHQVNIQDIMVYEVPDRANKDAGSLVEQLKKALGERFGKASLAEALAVINKLTKPVEVKEGQ